MVEMRAAFELALGHCFCWMRRQQHTKFHSQRGTKRHFGDPGRGLAALDLLCSACERIFRAGFSCAWIAAKRSYGVPIQRLSDAGHARSDRYNGLAHGDARQYDDHAERNFRSAVARRYDNAHRRAAGDFGVVKHDLL